MLMSRLGGNELPWRLHLTKDEREGVADGLLLLGNEMYLSIFLTLESCRLVSPELLSCETRLGQQYTCCLSI